jgi:hypothetical protein
MYNRLFYSILDSSIWLEPTPTRIVWITLLAAMDEDGFAKFSAIENLASRARVTIDECKEAVRVLTSPDINSGNPDNEGRRLERVPGGFMVCNAVTHRNVCTREHRRDLVRDRVKRYRERQKSLQLNSQDSKQLQNCNAPSVTKALPNVTPEYEYEYSYSLSTRRAECTKENRKRAAQIYLAYPRKVGKPRALMVIARMIQKYGADFLLAKTEEFSRTQIPGDQFTPYPSTWFQQERFNDSPETWIHQNGKVKPPTARELELERRMEAARERRK